MTADSKIKFHLRSYLVLYKLNFSRTLEEKTLKIFVFHSLKYYDILTRVEMDLLFTKIGLVS